MKPINLTILYRAVCVILLAYMQYASSQSCPWYTFSNSCMCTLDFQSRLGLKCNYSNNTAIERLLPGNQSLLTLQKVDLSMNNLSSLPHDDFSGISMIASIDMSINNFREFPSEIFTLSNISRLDISKNSLQHLTLSVLSHISENGTLDVSENFIQYISEPIDSIMAGKYLYLIDISHNAISVINDTSSLWDLCIQLDLSYNKLEQFSPKLASHIQILDISFNSIKELKADSFSNFVHLKHLNLSHNQVFKISETTFHYLTSLISLVLSHNKLESLHADSFKNAQRLEVLDISNNLLQSLEYESFRGLDYSLLELNLSDNRLSAIAMKSLMVLQDLRVISLSNNKDLMTVNFDLPSHLKQIDLQNSSLQEINECKFIQLYDIEVLNVENNPLKCSCHLSWLYSKYEVIRMSNSAKSEIPPPISPWKCINSDGNSQSIGDFDSGECLDHNNTPAHCAITIIVKSTENKNFSMQIVKNGDNIIVKWTLNNSMDTYGFKVVVKNIDNGDIMSTSPMIQNDVREYTIYQSSENSATICVQVMGNSTRILMEECDNIIPFDLKMITGILAGTIFLIPVILIFVYIAYKDKKTMAKLRYQLLEESNAETMGHKTEETMEIATEPETSLAKERQSHRTSATTSSVKETEHVHAKPSFIFENKHYMPDDGQEESNNTGRKNNVVLKKTDVVWHTDQGEFEQYSNKL